MFRANPPGQIAREVFQKFVEIEQMFAELIRDIVDDLIVGFIIGNYSFAAHGTMFNTTPVVGPDIDAGWTRVTAFDTVASERRVLLDPTNDQWTFLNAGVYQTSVELVLTHIEAQQGRTFRIRLNNGVTAAGAGVPVAVARNQPGTNIALSFLQDIQIADPNRTFFLEVGGQDVVGGVTWEACSVTIVNVGAWIDDVPVGKRKNP